jgi:S-adenosylmethionine hydrolase
MLENPIITLTTDFGLKDPFVGLLKGIILGINPNAMIVDITHNIQRHNIFEASQTLLMSYKFFPTSTIHVVVVDPGVGSHRRPVLVITEDYYFIGPDNGVFATIYEDCQSNFLKVYHITSDHYFLPTIGSTFHGRDIFAPVAAWLAKGVNSHKFGEPIDDYVKISLPKPEQLSERCISGEIISIDTFGNAITNISNKVLSKLGPLDSKDNFRLTFLNEQMPLVNFYAENENNHPAGIINSFGHLEIFVYKNSAAEMFNIKIGDKVNIELI